MKKTWTLILACMMIFTLSACGKQQADSTAADSTAETETAQSSESSQNTAATVGQTLLQDFRSRMEADPSLDAQSLADALLTNEQLPFAGASMPVENGLLTGFGNTEITGFQEGVLFSPVISTIPFVGYIFILEEGCDTEAFLKTLEDNADPRWNICTEADEVGIDHVGNTVFFLMCPSSFEDDSENAMQE